MTAWHWQAVFVQFSCICCSVVVNDSFGRAAAETSVAETVLLKCSCVHCKVDKLKDGERAEMTSVLDLRVLNRHKVSDGYTGVCCTCRRPRSGSMLRCQLCLELFHCMSLQHDSLRFFLAETSSTKHDKPSRACFVNVYIDDLAGYYSWLGTLLHSAMCMLWVCQCVVAAVRMTPVTHFALPWTTLWLTSLYHGLPYDSLRFTMDYLMTHFALPWTTFIDHCTGPRLSCLLVYL